jgi:hypothetical protein
MEPRILEDHLVLVGMPQHTTKYRDLGRHSRFCLHTATVDPYVGDGDANLWGEAVNLQEPGLHGPFANNLFDEAGLDLPGAGARPVLHSRPHLRRIGGVR